MAVSTFPPARYFGLPHSPTTRWHELALNALAAPDEATADDQRDAKPARQSALGHPPNSAATRVRVHGVRAQHSQLREIPGRRDVSRLGGSTAFHAPAQQRW